MYSRILKIEGTKSAFLFGARGTGKSTWLRSVFKESVYIDLLEDEIFLRLSSNPQKLSEYI